MATPIAGIPEINESDNLKFKTANESARSLEALGIGAAIDTEILTPPGSPTEGDIYIINGVGAVATAWDGFDFEIVQWISPAWVVYNKFVGLTIPVLATETFWRYTGVTGQEWQEVQERFEETPIILPYTLGESDRGKELIVASGTGNFNIPNSTTGFPDYFRCLLTLDGTGDVTIQRVDTTTTDLVLESGNQQLDVEGRTVTIRKRTGNIIKVDGALNP